MVPDIRARLDDEYNKTVTVHHQPANIERVLLYGILMALVVGGILSVMHHDRPTDVNDDPLFQRF